MTDETKNFSVRRWNFFKGWIFEYFLSWVRKKDFANFVNRKFSKDCLYMGKLFQCVNKVQLF